MLNGHTPESQLNGSQRPDYTTNHTSNNVKLTKFSLQRHLPDRWSAHMAVQSDSNERNTFGSFIPEISYIFKYELHIIRKHIQGAL